MLDVKNALEVINEVVVIPAAIIIFFLLMYIVFYLRNKDPDIIRSKIFLKYEEFKKAFMLFALFAFVLVMHVSLIYIPHFFLFNDNPLIDDIQRFFGLTLTLIMITFVSYIYRSMK
jgi:hypothetical protein